MIKDGSGSKGSGSEPTQIDLGDDLIEKTAIIPGHPSSPASEQRSDSSSVGATDPPVFNAEEQIQNARILLSEGFPEEAKKVLRQILVADSGNLESRKLLEEIHASELQQMFGSAEPVIRKSLLDPYDESILTSDSEEIVRILERDMRPGLRGAARDVSYFREFFQDVKLTEGFVGKIERDIGDSPGDHVDLAIGFIEMGLYPVAIRLLQALVSSSVERDRINAVALVAYAYILNEQSYEAISALQPLLNDNDVAKSAKTEAFYLMARALEALSFRAEAIGWFMQAQENEPGYRDSADRISRCRAALNPPQGPGRGPARGSRR